MRGPRPQFAGQGHSFMRRALYLTCDSCTFLTAPFRWGLVHMLLEKAIEVLHSVVTKEGRNGADLVRREYAEQRLREGESGLYLALNHCLVVFLKEDSLERSHLDAEFPRYGRQPQLHVSVRIENEMMNGAREVFKKRGAERLFRRCSQSAYLSNDLVLNCRQRTGGTA